MLIYKITNRINGKVYIGKWHGKSTQERWKQHIWYASKGSPLYFHRAIRKYGPSMFDVQVIDRAETLEELAKKEMFYIASYESNNPENGYNMTLGGERIVGAMLGRKHSEITKRKIGAGNKGKKRTIKDKERLAKVLTERWQSKQFRQHIKDTSGVFLQSEECKHKKAIAMSRYEVRQKLRDSWTLERKQRAAATLRKTRAKHGPPVLSKCEPYHNFIIERIALGYSAAAIWRILVDKYQFDGSEKNTRKFVRQNRIKRSKAVSATAA